MEERAAIQQRYENALDALIEKVREDHTILAAILLGSLAYDTVWEKSDIDLLLITHEAKLNRESYVLVEDGIIIHAYLQTRSTFKRTLEGAVHSSFMHSLLMKGRILFSRDDTLQELFENRHHIGARDREIQLLRAGTWVIPSLQKAEKWFYVRKDLDYSFFWIMKTLDSLATIETLLHGEVTGREVVLQALRHNSGFFGNVYTDLIRQEKTPEAIEAALKAIHTYLCERTPVLFKPIFVFLSEAGGVRSATEINHYFRNQMNLECADMACEWLADEQYIQKVSSPLRLTEKSRVDVQEAAYYYDGDIS